MPFNQPALAAKTPFEIKSASVGALAFVLHDTSIKSILAHVHAKFACVDTANTPIVIDVSLLEEQGIAQDISLQQLVSVLRQHNLQPVAIVGATGDLLKSALDMGLQEEEITNHGIQKSGPSSETVKQLATQPQATLHDDSLPATKEQLQQLLNQHRQEVAHELHSIYQNQLNEQITISVRNATDSMQMRPLVVDKPMRSGQRIYAEKADLIILGSVSHGAEVLADGDIHIYGALRGRALAGVTGNKNARIYVHAMDPELISVAGIYLLMDTPLPEDISGKPAKVHLEGNRLVVSHLYD